jgi:hypothetical protein
VQTLGGTPLTDSGPVDHRHHYGVGMAVADVNGTSHWGGRTFIEHVGPTLLQNHGRQVGDDVRPDGSALTESVSWLDEHGGRQLTEERRVSARLLEGPSQSGGARPGGAHRGWVLDWRSVLHATDGPLEIRSPATNGPPKHRAREVLAARLLTKPRCTEVGEVLREPLGRDEALRVRVLGEARVGVERCRHGSSSSGRLAVRATVRTARPATTPRVQDVGPRYETGVRELLRAQRSRPCQTGQHRRR